jgi:hypothetical protein
MNSHGKCPGTNGLTGGYHDQTRQVCLAPTNQENTMKTLLYFGLALFLAACSVEMNSDETQAQEPVTIIEDIAVETGIHNVQCGCTIDGIGKCGNYIEIADQFVVIENSEELGLGAMEWCKHGPAQAEAAGEVKNGKFIAASLVVQE